MKLKCVQFSPFKYISELSLPCCKIVQSQLRVIIYINFEELESLILHTKFQDQRTSGSGVYDF